MRGRIFLSLLLAGVCAGAQAGDTPLTPDFRLSDLAGTRVVGADGWTVEGGILTSPRASGPKWLLLGPQYQDVAVETEVRCGAACRISLVLRAEPANDGGFSGILVPVGQDGLEAERVRVSADGSIMARSPLGGGAFGRRYVSSPPAAAPTAPPRAPSPPVASPFPPPDGAWRDDRWNKVRLFLDTNVVRANLNDSPAGEWVADVDGYGTVALLVESDDRALFRNLTVSDMARRDRKAPAGSDRFHQQTLQDFFYGWSAATGDINRDGHLDIVSGPYLYFGPGFTQSREFAVAEPANPTLDYPKFFEQYVADFTGDGWLDILAVAHAPPFVRLFVNPGNVSRRWSVSNVVDLLRSEKTVLADIDGDGRPELVYTVSGELRMAKPDPNAPTAPWSVTTLSAEGVGPGMTHGLGSGDIDGDGRVDIVSRFGWWSRGATGESWRYHARLFGRHGWGGAGGAGMAVYDVNGDGLNDIVTSLSAHGHGLAWYEQTRGADKQVGFVEHVIMEGPGGRNAGGVVFSQAHGAKTGDIDGDGLPDLVVGKRYFSHLETAYDPDSWGEPVLYWYRTVRDRRAPGGARFVPTLIDNRLGVGSDLVVEDLDRDGRTDIVTAGRFGAAIFWNRNEGGR